MPVFGESTMDQDLPFHRSISVCVVEVASLKCDPAAQQSDVETHATPRSSLSLIEVFGELTIAHEVPSQCSISVCLLPN
jgi:hypothetical protein